MNTLYTGDLKRLLNKLDRDLDAFLLLQKGNLGTLFLIMCKIKHLLDSQPFIDRDVTPPVYTWP